MWSREWHIIWFRGWYITLMCHVGWWTIPLCVEVHLPPTGWAFEVALLCLRLEIVLCPFYTPNG